MSALHDMVFPIALRSALCTAVNFTGHGILHPPYRAMESTIVAPLNRFGSRIVRLRPGQNMHHVQIRAVFMCYRECVGKRQF